MQACEQSIIYQVLDGGVGRRSLSLIDSWHHFAWPTATVHAGAVQYTIGQTAFVNYFMALLEIRYLLGRIVGSSFHFTILFTPNGQHIFACEQTGITKIKYINMLLNSL